MLRWTGAWDDYLDWQTRDKRTLKHVNVLIRDAMRSPFAGLDKPEPLKWELQGAWSVASISRTGWCIWSRAGICAFCPPWPLLSVLVECWQHLFSKKN